MNSVLSAALELQQFCRKQNWQFCFIGGLAVHYWGEPRFTQDADLTLLTGFGTEAEYIDILLETFHGRMENTREFALQYRVLLLEASNGVPLDVALGGMLFEENSVQRAQFCDISPDCSLYICGPEDLIVHKVFANRPQDWVDVRSIIARQGEKLDMKIVWSELEPLVALKETPETLDQLRNLSKEYSLS